MGLILDSSVLVDAERRGQTARQLLTGIADAHGNVDTGISVITLMELAHGAARAETAQRRGNRLRFIQDFTSALAIYPVTAAIALRAGLIDGENQAEGLRLPLSDLLIGVTALGLGYGVGTRNVRHFRLIPGLSITQI